MTELCSQPRAIVTVALSKLRKKNRARRKAVALRLKYLKIVQMERANLTKTADLLSEHCLFQTTDVEHARAMVAERFCDHELIPGAAHGNFDACHHHVSGQNLSLNYMKYGCDVCINPGELTDFYLVQIPLCGTAKVRNGRRTVEATCRTGSVLNPTRETHMIWQGGCEKLLCQISATALHQAAERLLGQSISCPIVFDPEVQLSSPALKRWKAKFRAAVAVADQQGAFGKNTHRHQALFEEEMITGFLMAQPSTINHILNEAKAQISSSQINRARTFILENLSDPITVAQIANAAGCSVRSLQLAFQQSFGCTPLHFLQRQRLNQAHMLFQSRTEDILVSDIAYETGFSHLGRFAIAYREAFGCSPSETLRQNRFC